MEQTREQYPVSKFAKARREKAEDGGKDGQEDEDEVTGGWGMWQGLGMPAIAGADTENTRRDPYKSKNDSKSHKEEGSDGGEESEDEDEIDGGERKVDKTADKSKRRGKRKPNAIMDNLRSFLPEASKNRKAQMELAKQMQSGREKREDDEDLLKKTKKFRELAFVIGKELAWQGIFYDPFPTVQIQGDIAIPASDPILHALDVNRVREQCGCLSILASRKGIYTRLFASQL